MKQILILLLLFSLNFVFGQTRAEKLFRKAKQYYFSGDTVQSIKYCDKAIKSDTGFFEPFVLKAQIFADKQDFAKAAFYMQKAIETEPTYLPLYRVIAGYYLKAKQFDAAIATVTTYIEQERDTVSLAYAKRLMQTAKFRKYQYRHPKLFDPIRLPNVINTRKSEYFPTISADNQSIIFTRQNPYFDKQEDIYISRKKNGQYQKAKSLSGLINTRANEGAHTVSADGTVLIFTRCSPTTGCDLYISYKQTDGFWSVPVKLPPPVNTRYWESQPSLSADNKTLYFASNRPGGKGKMDIWKVSYLGKGKWGKVRNLREINTKGNEMSPFIHFDSETLYFVSDYLSGMGGFDIFMSRKKDNKWSKPVNLGYPINTDKDEYRLVVTADGSTGYFSTQKDTLYHQDIYSFKLNDSIRPHKTLYVKGKIFDKSTLSQIPAGQIFIVNIRNNDTVLLVNNASFFLACLKPDNIYALNVIKKGYLFYSKSFSLINLPDTLTHYNLDVFLEPLTKASVFVLNNIFFKTDSYELDTTSFAELNQLVKFLKINKNLKIKVEGHTDSVGSYTYNVELSKNRALSVKKYLQSKGIAANRIEYEGYGYTRPVATNKTEKGRQLNRRTEIRIIDR